MTLHQLAFDNFERTNENPLSDSGKWAAPSGMDPCRTNAGGLATASNTGGADNVSYRSDVGSKTDQYSEITVDAFCCPVVRVSSGGHTYYLAAYDDGNSLILIYKRVAGAYPDDNDYAFVASGAGDATAGTRLRLEAEGTTLRAYVDDVLKVTTTDSEIASGYMGILTETTHGIRGFSGGDFAGAAYTLTAGQGTYTLTGQATGAKATRRMTAAQGTYTMTGQTVSMRRGPNMTAVQGTYTINGQTVTLARGSKTMGATQGSYALTGQTVTLARTRIMAASQGTYTLDGSLVVADYALTAQQGTYTQTGYDTGLRATRRVTAAQGTYSMTGQTVGLSKLSGTLQPETATYTLSGQSVVLTKSHLPLVAVAGSYSLSGQTVAFHGAHKIAGGVGSYTLTGQNSILVWSGGAPFTLVAPRGTYTLSGQAAGRKSTYVLQAGDGSYSINGQAVSLSYSGFIPLDSTLTENLTQDQIVMWRRRRRRIMLQNVAASETNTPAE